MKKVDTRGIAILARPSRIAFAVQRAGLPTDSRATHCVVFPKADAICPAKRAIAGGTVGAAATPANREVSRRARCAHGPGGSDALPQRSEILVRRQRRTLQALYASAQGSVARVRIVCPDLVEHRRAIVSRRHGTARLVHQTPADACRTGSEQVAKHTEARRLRREETFRSIQVANQAAPLGCHVQHQLQALPRQPGSSASPPTRRRSHRPRRRSPSRMPSVAARSSEASSGVCGSSSRVR